MISNKLIILAAAGLLLCGTVGAQNYSVSTNVLDYANLGTLNVEASCGIARQWSLCAGVKYNPFSFGDGEKEVALRQRSIETGARFWPWHIFSGWWLGAKLKYQEYSEGGIKGPSSMEGDRYGGGLSAGYAFMLNTHLNLDIGVGLWGGYDKWRTYDCMRCGKVMGTGDDIFFRPNDIILTLSYIF